ncbi:MAG: flavodoxin-dependent (E)-4-hydroxy-3-methylbut-2-enyl-diphosphate synthase [Bacilli bacterium]|jgi:(E)-4-hydroxy-3-methylbut-2-enyl-diphosphate synthase|nr:flavodoxin-dependent (E)-4-hydroxy-3-methylbut-2-enyl-diphosphate synthase [Bacilli bacterium]
MIHRCDTKKIRVGNIIIGGSDSIIIQSMCNTKTKDTKATIKQINDLEKAGAQIVRLALLDQADAKALKIIKKHTNIPLVADIHFDYKLALIAIENDIDKIRINPGNIGSQERIKKVVKACQSKNIPIRIGINAGSLEKEILEEYGYPCAQAMIASAKKHIKILEDLNFYDICLSLKASEISLCMEAYELAAQEFNYPLHLGITEAGNEFSGTIKSVAGLAPLIKAGIGSTIRISLSDDPLKEIRVCKELLKNYHLAFNIPTLISCPTCGRLQYDMFKVVNIIDQYLENKQSNIKVAIMGCVVNGPGEAKQADIGIAGGKEQAILFKKGQIIKTIQEAEIIDVLKKEIDIFIKYELTNNINQNNK